MYLVAQTLHIVLPHKRVNSNVSNVKKMLKTIISTGDSNQVEMCVCVCQIGNPLKIHKRKGVLDECADADVAKSVKNHPKVREVNRAARQAAWEAVLHGHGHFY